ncbi:unnamed protein product [Dimorphilus gyrociliatus]|uniref:SOCS box domain-containing protein n=1 Tax=Dimorphilus gyrociliatus TaxID=2664684 RepID=A0A7I8WE47_9ANNE|nr:unnamed protein product [Dimorphilus gyrociliatus]
MLLSHGCDLNSGVCSLPLHLACKLGYSNIVQLLLDAGARPDIPKGLCHGVPHYIKTCSPDKPPKFLCNRIRNPATALSYAILSDQPEVVQVLLDNSAHMNTELLLHEACRFRAKPCVELLISMFPEQVNRRDKKGFAPLHYALRGPKGRDCAITLLETVKNISPDSFLCEQGTLLHELYVSEDSTSFLRLTQLMLAKGPKDLAYRPTPVDGDTPLHKLLKYFGGNHPRNRQQYVDEVIGCVRLLLKHNANPNAPNNRGESALHALLTHHTGRPLFHLRDRFGVGPKYLRTVLENVGILMQILLDGGALPNQKHAPNFVSPLYYLTRIICSMSPNLLKNTADQVKNCLKIICKRGADVNVINANEDNVVTLLMSSLSRWLHQTADDEHKMHFLLSITHDILELLLEHGLDPEVVLRKNLKQFIIIFNVTALHEHFITYLNRLLRCIIRLGGNPNLIKFCDNSRSLSYSTSCLLYYFARGFYIHSRYDNRFAFHILDVFENTLTQPNLYECVNGICANLELEFTSAYEIKRKIMEICSRPRTLKQLVRICIYQSLGWQLQRKCPQLNLPPYLTEYLTYVQC